MSNSLNWQAENGIVTFSGDLDRETLLPFWNKRQQILTPDIQVLDVANLDRVDSAGLALLIHILDESAQRNQMLKLAGMTGKLQTLAALYNLQQIIEPYLVSPTDMV
ncbi:lipid asymmetry maintenance protein MlaB [Budvicia diplopodorum]|uniref:lipid asymmetry maintenance protein MlaB n=1 Tax=Budvicia diplopodorum TaxID=1119056 RepID=UPI00135B7AF5|nr:lipid asymmetry maintenance protein MlaB [Budvicia diplopodorum]